ncbi:histidine phosphatase superfamily [Auriculariales sp. MPI-PUGE-AT-0066]|nr:histidine phosphatase superfamily [Auriculariales sp. MPI-PUGE-AT-0066]
MLLTAAVAIALALGNAAAAAETVLGAVIFTRHGDRTPKVWSPYHLTTLGLNQNFNAGSFCRSTYIAKDAPKQILKISPDLAQADQLYVGTPDEPTLFSTTAAFVQGLYPPLAASAATGESLANGSTVNLPEGLNYIQMHGEDSDAPDTIWLKGDVNCPTYLNASASYKQSEEFVALTAATKAFYASFKPLLDGVFAEKDLTYDKAYTIFDYMNVMKVHNKTVSEALTADQLFQLRTLADTHEWALMYNSSQSERSLPARTFIAKIHEQLSATVSSATGPRLSVLTGSYNTFQSWFGLASLHKVDPDFFGLPDYASTLVFEAVTNADTASGLPSLDDVSIRFLFRNGSAANAPLTAWPLFETGKETLPWNEWEQHVIELQIASPDAWCGVCHATKKEKTFCPAVLEAVGPTLSAKKASMSAAVAGVTGAATTLGVISLLVVVAGCLGLRLTRRKRAAPAVLQPALVKGSEMSSSSSIV